MIHNTAIINSKAKISSNVKIGDGVKIHIGAQIHHDVSIGKYSTLAPSSLILGSVKIGNYSFIGANSIIKQNIKIGTNVYDESYLVGRVIEVNFKSSRVLLLNDLNSRIPVSLDVDNSQAILTGSGTKNPKLEYLPEEYEFKEDINVFASGKERIFIPGTPIGKTTETGEVKLHVDPNQLSFVTVILTRNNKEKF